MKLLRTFHPRSLRLRCALTGFCVLLVAGCETQTVVLSPPMHARVVDGVTRRPLDDVRVTLVSLDGPEVATAYSDQGGFVAMPGLLGHNDIVVGVVTAKPRLAVHAIFERPGYERYTIDSVNGYGFFKGYTDVHLYREGH